MPAATPTPLATVVRQIPTDLDTPVSVFLRLRGQGPAFMLESVTGGEQLARYTFIGADVRETFVLRGHSLETICKGERSTAEIPAGEDALDALRRLLARHTCPPNPALPRFAGGLAGYLGYDLVRFFEPSVPAEPHTLPDAIFLHADTLVAFDHAFGRLVLIANAPTAAEANARLDQLQQNLAAPLPNPSTSLRASPQSQTLHANFTRAGYTAAVRQAQQHIAAGDIFQVVPSQRLYRETEADSFQIYRALRRLNPSPYMFYFDFADTLGDESFRLIGASPEVHVRLENGTAALRPIAGTRPRGGAPPEDASLERELLADPKERAEHLMLIDLARNDLGRVCEYGSVRVPESFVVERYSHVMHIVSHTEGRLRPGLDAFDLLRATFPAGTVSGAPKIRAMQIIRQLEPEPRGPYAGAVGYFGYDGNADTCIALRTIVMRGRTVSIQAGAGIVADSDPDAEYEETLNKAKALAVAVAMAEQDAGVPGFTVSGL
jgi:anthranilate synthase component 1